MSHTRPTATGWMRGQGEPVETLANPPGDGIGPDHTPPDAIDGLDKREAKRLDKDHRERTQSGSVPAEALVSPEPNDGEREPATPHPFPDARATEPQDPAGERPDDPREGRAAR